MDEKQPALTTVERDLAHIASHTGTDAFLLDALDLAEDGVGMAVGMLLNGMIVTGALARLEAAAEMLDEVRGTIAEIVAKPDDRTDEEWADTLERFRTHSAHDLVKLREDDERLWREVEAMKISGSSDRDSLPGDLRRRVIRAQTRRFVTLRDAHIQAPGQIGITHVPVLRVAIAQIAAWWTVPPNADGQSSFALWSTEAPEQAS